VTDGGAPSSERMRRAGPDDGSTLLLTIFYGFLALVLVLLVTAATSVYLERKRLYALADGAALVGAEAFPLESVRASERGIRPVLEPARVEAAVAGFVAGPPGERFEGLRVVRATSDDGLSATVTLGADWRPPVVSLLVPEGLPIEVTAVARSVLD